MFHNSGDMYCVYAGYVFYSTEEKRNAERLYNSVERSIKDHLGLSIKDELKSYGLEPKYKKRLYSVLNKFNRFSCVIDNSKIKPEIWSHKKHKQRFLDYAIKRTIKDTLTAGSKAGLISLTSPISIHIFFDEHTTATSGIYELEEALKEELIQGTFNFNYRLFFKPILVKQSSVNLRHSNSKNVTLIRAADVVANRVFYKLNRKHLPPSNVQFVLQHHCWCNHP